MYFKYFPKALYSFNLGSNKTVSVTNIFARFKIRSQVLNNAVAMYKYQVRDGDTPEIIAFQQYGDPNYHWVVCLVNELEDPQFDFPLQQDAFERKLIKQYGYTSIAEAYSDIHHYELEVKKVTNEVNGPSTVTTNNYIVTLQQYNNLSNTIVNVSVNAPTVETVQFRANNADPNTAITSTITITSTYKPVYVYDYENELNEQKRQIKLLKPQYIESLVNELSTILND